MILKQMNQIIQNMNQNHPLQNQSLTNQKSRKNVRNYVDSYDQNLMDMIKDIRI